MILYRLCEHNPPTEADILSQFELNIPLRDNSPDGEKNHHGLSVHDSYRESERQAKSIIAARLRAGRPVANMFIAEIDLPDDDARYTVRRTYPKNEGHHTIDASREDRHAMLDYVTRVSRVHPPPGS